MKKKILYFALLLCGMSYAQIPTNDILAWYDFDGANPLQEQSNGDNFTKTGSNATVVTDRFGNNDAYSLNGDYLDRIDVPSTASNLSLSFWIKTSSTSTVDEVIINDTNTADPSVFATGATTVYASTTGANTDTGYLITLRNGVIHLKAQSKSEHTVNTHIYLYRIVTNNTVLVNDDNWHHVYVYINEDTSTSGLASMSAQINVDGTLTSASTGNSQYLSTYLFTSIHSTGTMTVGNIQGTLPAVNTYKDAIDELLIYDRALTTAEQETIRNTGNYCFTPSESILATTVTGQTTTEIAINGTTGAIYDIAYHSTSEPFSNATIVTGLSSGAVATTLTNLQASTPYKLYIREQCFITTEWSLGVDFRTAGIIYVNEASTGNNDGSNWVNAYNELTDALTNNASNGEIWVASGTYKPATTIRTTYFDIIASSMSIYGGFAGTETQLSERVVGTNETILSGDLNGDDVNVTGFASNYANTTRNADNSYHIINITSAGNNLLLDGLTISDAHNNLSATEQGGAIVKASSVANLTLKNCIIKDNVSRNANAGLLAEFNLNSTTITGNLTIENCQFINNMSRWGTGLYSFIRANSDVDITIANSLFDSNIAEDLSTSLLGYSGSAMWLRNISGNSTSSLNIDITNSTFVNNIDTGTEQSLNNFTRATVGLGQSSASTSNTNATIANSIFWNNQAAGGVTARSITDLYEFPLTSLTIINSIDESNFNDDSITSTTATSNADPLFTDLANGDYTLTAASPAIDSGDNTYVIGMTDLNNNPRIFNTTVDMGAYEFGSTTLSINGFDTKIDDLMLYPNPAQFLLNIQTTENIKSVTIYSMLGTKVLESNTNTINVSALSNGTYLVQIKTQNGKTTTKRFVKN